MLLSFEIWQILIADGWHLLGLLAQTILIVFGLVVGALVLFALLGAGFFLVLMALHFVKGLTRNRKAIKRTSAGRYRP